MSQQYYTHVDVKIIEELKASIEALEVFMQQQDDHIFDLETRLRIAEDKLYDVQSTLWAMEGDNP